MRVGPELRDRLRDQHVEPVQAFGLVGVHVVVCLCEDGGRRQARRRAEDVGGGALAVELVRGGGGRGEGDGAAAVAVGEGARRGGGFGGGGVAEDEEFDEAADQDDDGELAEEKALGEGETGSVLMIFHSLCLVYGRELTRTAAVGAAEERHLRYC